MGEGLKALFAMVTSHSRIADSAERQSRIGQVQNCVIDTAASKGAGTENLIYSLSVF
jgi:hypothetical protein